MTTRIISFSEIDTAKQCSHKHQLAYIERWSIPTDELSALSKGTAWHVVMETHYRVLQRCQTQGITGPAREKAVHDAVLPVIAEMSPDLQEVIEWMYLGYIGMWGLDDQWKVLAVEHPAQIRLPTPRGGRSSFILKVKIDLVIKDHTGKIHVVDHKSGKDLPHKKSLEFDDQFGLYTWAMQQLGKKVHGQIYNAARTLRTQKAQPLDSRFSRTPLYRTPQELERVAIETYQLARSRYQEQAQCERDGTDAPRHTSTMGTCDWRCDFTDPCLLGRKTTPLDERLFLKAKGFLQDPTRH